jgi:hypothetical protein
MKPPMDWCHRIITCGAQPLMIRPLSFTRSSKPSASHSSTSGNFFPALITQVNGFPEASSPSPSSTSCSGAVQARLPKLTKITEPGFIESSHCMHCASFIEALFPLAATVLLSWLHKHIGPTVQTFFPEISSKDSMYRASSSWKLFMTTPLHLISSS